MTGYAPPELKKSDQKTPEYPGPITVHVPGPMVVAQGWQCPVCKTVWNPSFPMCSNCAPKKVGTSGDTQG